jgi:type VI protein secretion system component VasK
MSSDAWRAVWLVVGLYLGVIGIMAVWVLRDVRTTNAWLRDAERTKSEASDGEAKEEEASHETIKGDV